MISSSGNVLPNKILRVFTERRAVKTKRNLEKYKDIEPSPHMLEELKCLKSPAFTLAPDYD